MGIAYKMFRSDLIVVLRDLIGEKWRFDEVGEWVYGWIWRKRRKWTWNNIFLPQNATSTRNHGTIHDKPLRVSSKNYGQSVQFNSCHLIKLLETNFFKHQHLKFSLQNCKLTSFTIFTFKTHIYMHYRLELTSNAQNVCNAYNA